MDGAVCHVQCEISSVQVTGLACTGTGPRDLFLRCHVPAGGGRTIQIDSRRHVSDDDEASASLTWRDVASLACDGPPARVRELVAADTRSVVFEVRRRRHRSRPVLQLGLGLVGCAAAIGPPSAASELVGRAKVPWRDVVVVSGAGEEDEMGAAAMERRVALEVGAVSRGGGASSPAPVMSVRMSVRVSETPAPQRETCGCEWSAGGDDDGVFGVAACGVADDLGE